MNETEVAVIGGGPAGAALAARLAAGGRETVLFERLPQPRWRAGGVYTSPLTRRRLLDLGLPPAVVDELIRPISAMVVTMAEGDASCRLEYGPPHACGVDRVRLERALLALARAQGATVYEGAPLIGLDLGGRPRLTVSGATGAQAWRATLVIGADGPSSMVARAAGVTRPARRFRRAALTVHRADPSAPPETTPMEAEVVLGAGWYCGIAPVPGGRVNLGLVLGETDLRRELAGGGGLGGGLGGVLDRRLELLPPRASARAWVRAPATDEIQVALPLAHRVRRTAGRNFLLVGDAAGFLDPLSGEGLQRALASAELAADAIGRWSAGDPGALAGYDRRLSARFRGKDALSWLLQGFLGQPLLARHALRKLSRHGRQRDTFAGALADMLPSSRVLDPRFLARVLAP